MRYIVILLFCFSAVTYGETLEQLIDTALRNNPSLEMLATKIQANSYAVEQSDHVENPKLLLSTNSLDTNEKMHQTILTLQQKIPFYGKRDAKEGVLKAEGSVLEEQLNFARVELIKKLKIEAYAIWELEALYALNAEYIALTQQNISLYESYASISSAEHMGLMKAELSLSDLKIIQSKLKAQLKVAYAHLSYLCASDVTNLELSLKMGDKSDISKLKAQLRNNPKLLVEEKKLSKQNAALKMVDLTNYPDLTLVVGYSHRDNFDDFFNFGVGLSLPIYGSEDLKVQEQRAHLLAQKNAQTDTQYLIDQELQSYIAQMDSAREIYHIVQEDALPKVEHMFDLSNASVRVGGDLFKYIDVLFTKLSLEKKSIAAIGDYYKAKAKISALAGMKR
ncbi:TolC family protein [Sulfurimonas microaerophilic]|uniref:TolC family protein n=1 Tax=Sulfurimonas microaerophilic TaxID=3058392 RepID=UPI00271544CA|nr:TolC family protein [Sulfurimonas sp. hsl 1-7]